LVVSGKRNIGIELLGTFHIVDQHLRNAVAFQRDNALPWVGIFRLMGQHKHAVFAQQRSQAFVITDFSGFVPTRGSTDSIFRSSFHHQHFQTALTLNLNNQRAFVFKVGRQ